MLIPGAILEPSGDPLGGLGVSGGASGGFWRDLVEIFGEDEPKMGQVGSKLRPRWAMIAPRLPCWSEFGSFWEGPGSTFGYFFRDL